MAVKRDASGRFLPGHGGSKPKGTLHVHAILKDRLSDFLRHRLADLPKLWRKLSDRDKARLLVDLLPFVMQKQSSVEMTTVTEPTKDAIARVFDFSNDDDVDMWVSEVKEKAFPKASGDQ